MATGGPGGPNLGISKGGGPTIRSFSIPTTVPGPGTPVTFTYRPPLYTNPRGPEYPVSLRSWTNLFQQPTVVPPVTIYTYRGPLYTLPRGPEYHIQLRQWLGRLPPVIVGMPVGDIIIDRSMLAVRDIRADININNLALTTPPVPPEIILLGQALI
jgi:hypothetical protein